MGRKLFVGNLDSTVNDQQLADLFAGHGEVVNATVVTNRTTGESRRFGFVIMGSDEQARRAMNALDGASFVERQIRVSPARERTVAPESPQRLRLRLPFRLVSSRPKSSDQS
jgi:RNA recognition motif-containing protein